MTQAIRAVERHQGIKCEIFVRGIRAVRIMHAYHKNVEVKSFDLPPALAALKGTKLQRWLSASALSHCMAYLDMLDQQAA